MNMKNIFMCLCSLIKGDQGQSGNQGSPGSRGEKVEQRRMLSYHDLFRKCLYLIVILIESNRDKIRLWVSLCLAVAT